MRSTFAAIAVGLSLLAPSFAQSSTLAVAGTLAPGQTITLDLTGATPSAATFLLFGPVPGTTAVHLGPFGGFTAGLSWPFAVQPIGQTNGSGHLSYSVTIPNFPGPALLPSLTLQTVTVAPASGLPLLSFCVSTTATLVAAPFGARAALLHWHRTALGANALDHTPSTQGPLHLSGQQIGPCRTARALAIVHIAMFEALIAIEGGYQSYVGLAPVTAPTSRPAAIAQAGHDALAALYPSQAWIFDAELATDLASIPNSSAKAAGILVGHAAAAAILGQRAADGSNHAEPLVNTEFVCSNQPGHWRQDLGRGLGDRPRLSTDTVMAWQGPQVDRLWPDAIGSGGRDGRIRPELRSFGVPRP